MHAAARTGILLATGCLAILGHPTATAHAHAGPPFPIVSDVRVGPWRAWVWTDPDIGIGRFWVVLEPAQDRSVLPGTRVRVGVVPLSGRLPETVYEALPESVRRGERHYAEVEFDQGEWWRVRVIVDHPEGRSELVAQVEATPDGMIGPIGMIFYMLPFLAIGFIFLRWWLLGREREGDGEAAEAAPA